MARDAQSAVNGSIAGSTRCDNMRPFALGLILLAATAAALPPDPFIATPRTTQQFFQGRTESRGELRQLFSRPLAVVSHGRGRIESDGTLVLNQTVHQTGSDPKEREWRLREDRAGHCTGTVTDGVGPVNGTLTGSQLHMRFKLKGGLSVDQLMSFDPDGRSATNRITIRKLGVSVASINETIRKMD